MDICSVVSLDWGELLAEELLKRAECAGVGAVRTDDPAAVSFRAEDTEEMVEVIARHIIDDVRPFEMRRLTCLLPLENSERDELLPIAISLSSRKDHFSYVRSALSDHFETNRLLVTEGIVRFRMPALIEYWAACVDRAGEELLLGNSYSELFRILGLVSELGATDPKSLDMCLILHNDGSFVLTDENGCRIESSNCEINSLMGLLTGLGPAMLSVYDLTRGASDAVLRAIKSLFGDRARFFKIRS